MASHWMRRSAEWNDLSKSVLSQKKNWVGAGRTDNRILIADYRCYDSVGLYNVFRKATKDDKPTEIFKGSLDG